MAPFKLTRSNKFANFVLLISTSTVNILLPHITYIALRISLNMLRLRQSYARRAAAPFIRLRPPCRLIQTGPVPSLHDILDPPLDASERHSIEENAVYNMVKPIAPNDLFVSCTTFDIHGNVTAVSKKYPRAQFLNDNNLFPRDLRKVDSSSIDVAPSVMVRSQNAIIVNLLHVKAIIKSDSLKIFDTATPAVATKLGLLMYDLELKLKAPSSLPYEFRALECILISVVSYLEAELQTHITSCGQILAELEDNISHSSLQHLLIKLKFLSRFYQRASLIRNVLEDLLDNDEDMNGMSLTEVKQYDPDHQTQSLDIEMILETYYKHCDEVVQQAGALINDIKATEEIVDIIIDANRNALMLFEIKTSIYTLGFTVATLLPAFYGMNLKNYIEESYYGFGAVVVISVIQGILISVWNFKSLHRVETLTLMTKSPLQGKLAYRHRGGWYNRRFWSRLWYGSRAKAHYPTVKESDAIWQMINKKPH